MYPIDLGVEGRSWGCARAKAKAWRGDEKHSTGAGAGRVLCLAARLKLPSFKNVDP